MSVILLGAMEQRFILVILLVVLLVIFLAFSFLISGQPHKELSEKGARSVANEGQIDEEFNNVKLVDVINTAGQLTEFLKASPRDILVRH